MGVNAKGPGVRQGG